MAAKRFEMVSAQAFTLSGNSAPFAVATGVDLDVSVNCTAASGTTPTMHVFLQGSPDGGTTWYDVPCDMALTTNAAGANVAAKTTNRNINGDTAISAAGTKCNGRFRGLGYDTIRLAWVIGGTTPSFTFEADCVAK